MKGRNNLAKLEISSSLNKFKGNFNDKSDHIFDLEPCLTAITDAEMLLKVCSMQLFRCLNNEKPTFIFLILARSSYLTVVTRIMSRKSKGRVHKPANEPNLYSNCTENFLGDDI
jgi:hypothetical protein